jgi:hypothetical protein
MSPTSYRTAPPRDMEALSITQGKMPPRPLRNGVATDTDGLRFAHISTEGEAPSRLSHETPASSHARVAGAGSAPSVSSTKATRKAAARSGGSLRSGVPCRAPTAHARARRCGALRPRGGRGRRGKGPRERRASRPSRRAARPPASRSRSDTWCRASPSRNSGAPRPWR